MYEQKYVPSPLSRFCGKCHEKVRLNIKTGKWSKCQCDKKEKGLKFNATFTKKERKATKMFESLVKWRNKWKK